MIERYTESKRDGFMEKSQSERFEPDSEASIKKEKRGFFRRIGKKNFALTKKNFDEDEIRQKELERKAKKRKYFMDETGRWVHKTEKGIEGVPGFRLDTEYPELAEMYEESVGKYFGKFDKLGPGYSLSGVSRKLKNEGRWGYKERILDDIELFQMMGEIDWDNLNSIASRCGNRYYEAYNDLFSRTRLGEPYFLRELDRNYQRRQTLDKIFDGVGEVDDGRECFLEYHIAPTVMKFYSSEAAKPGFCDAIAKLVRDSSIAPSVTQSAPLGIQGVLTNGGGEFIGDFFELHTPIDLHESGLEKERIKNNILNHYVGNHGMKATTKGAMVKIFNLISRDDEEIRGIGDDFSNTGDGFFGLEDYTVECFSSASRPMDIDRLVRLHNEIPTTNFANREQNRQDAIRLQSAMFFKDRTFIHEEKPGIHEIVGAVVDYYDARGTDEFDKKEEALKRIEEQYGKKYGLDESMYDLAKYDEWAYVKHLDGSEKGDKIIDVLRRLKKNTEPTSIETPKTKYPSLNQALEEIKPIMDEKTGEIRVSVEEVGDAAARINQVLRESSGQIGIFPSTISAIVFLDKMAACALRGVDKKDWRELAFDPKFKEIVRFSQMTSSRSYDEREFEGFYNRFRTKCGEAFSEDGVVDGKVEDGYRILSARIAKNAGELAAAYASDEKTKRFSGAVWSGNLTHELIGMFDKF